jgi:hypothetical protein
MAAFRLLAKLVLYYAILAAVVAAALRIFPAWGEYLPVGRVQTLIAEAGVTQLQAHGGIPVARVEALGPSLVWLATAVLGALLASLPVSWVYMEIRNPTDYDQSLIDTIVVLPLVVTSIVVVVQHSLALSFSLAGIAGAARYRNSLKSSGDLLFILLSIGIGLSAGIGALELALVTSAAFNFCFVALWSSNYGERAKMKRFLNEFEHPAAHAHSAAGVVAATTAVAVATEVTETVEMRPDRSRKEEEDDD